MFRKTTLKTFAVLAIGAGFVNVTAVSNANGAERDLVIVGWGGATGAATEKTLVIPFASANGITAKVTSYSGGLAEVKAQVEANAVQWDVLDSDIPEANNGCDEGLLEPIDTSALAPAPDGTPATKDFLEGTIAECGVGNYVYSLVLAYNTEALPNGGPAKVTDVFDTKKFPGKRGLRKRPRVNLEWALMADGVPMDDVYEVLRTKEGVDRAFKKLDSIKDHIVWYSASAQAPQLLADREVVMTSAFNARLQDAIMKEKQPFKLVWDGQVWATGAWVVPKNSPNRDLAMKFIQYATSSEAMGAFTSQYPYGPTRVSANQFVDASVSELLPTSKAHFANALKRDDEFWAEYRDELNVRFSSWLNK
jgi:putative spermidine/putrescine transport system substrate-binding protein